MKMFGCDCGIENFDYPDCEDCLIDFAKEFNQENPNDVVEVIWGNVLVYSETPQKRKMEK